MVIKFERGTTQEQKEKILVEQFKEHLWNVEQAHSNPLWLDVRNFVETLRPEIFADMRREILNSKKADRTVS